VVEVVDHLPSKHIALSTNPSTEKEKKEERRGEEKKMETSWTW
jgi:hypothetical protein